MVGIAKEDGRMVNPERGKGVRGKGVRGEGRKAPTGLNAVTLPWPGDT